MEELIFFKVGIVFMILFEVYLVFITCSFGGYMRG